MSNTTWTAAQPDSHARSDRLRGYLEMDPTNLSLQRDLCDALLDAGATQEALLVLQEAIQQASPENDFVYGFEYRMGVIQRRLGQLGQAKLTFENLVQLGQKAPALLYELACVHMMMNESALAVELFSQLIDTPDYAKTYPDADFFAMRCLHMQARMDDAIALGERVLADGTKDARVLGALATLYVDNSQFAKAASLLNGMAPTPESIWSADTKAEINSANGYVALDEENLAVARHCFEASLSNDANFGRSLLGLGLVSAANGDLVQARQLLQRTVEVMPSHLGSWHTLAWMQLAQDDVEGAEQTFEQVRDQDPTFGESHGGLALIAALKGDKVKAHELCNLATRLDKNSMNVLATHMVLEHGSLKSPNVIKQALPLLAKRGSVKESFVQKTLHRFASSNDKRH